MSNASQTLVEKLQARVEHLSKVNETLQEKISRSDLLLEVSVSLSGALDFETIVAKAVGFAKHLGATSGEIHLLTDTGDVYFKSTYPERNELDNVDRQTLVRTVLNKGLDAWVLETGQLALVVDTLKDDRWLIIEYSDQTVSVRSAICAPLFLKHGRLKGAISFVHPEPHFFNQEHVNLLDTLTSHLVTAMENATYIADVKDSLREAHLMLDISRYFSSTSSYQEVHSAIWHSVSTIGAKHCILYACQGLTSNNLPTHAKITFVGSINPAHSRYLNHLFSLSEYAAFRELVSSQKTLVAEDIQNDERLSAAERTFFQELNTYSLAITPLASRGRTSGMLAIAYGEHHIFTDRELTIHRILCDQATMALEHVKQIEQTEQALTETQTLYRAGRVLAGAQGLKQILEEAMVEFVYGLGLDQGGITLITPDRLFGQLMAYLEMGELKEIEHLRFPIDDNIPYQRTLLSGQPFVSFDVPNDSRLADFRTFNREHDVKSTLQAPMIIHGVTVGWIGVDAVQDHRDFTQRETDLARAMADQIAIAIQNRRLLEQSTRRADQLQAVATVGEAVTGLTDLHEVLTLTVNLIRDRFGFYHVSIFMLDEADEWAVVRASTGEVGKIMVERPHKLGVGSNSIVGYVTHHAKPRIALDVGQDAVHFDNPLLPETRSEMALPLITRGKVIGALDVQSVEANAFSNEDVETLQVMADQVTTAIKTAWLFEETQRRLEEQAMLYRVGANIGGTLSLEQTAEIIVAEAAQMLDCARCTITVIEPDETFSVLGHYTRQDTDPANIEQTHRAAVLATVGGSQRTTVRYADDDTLTGWEAEYLKQVGSAMVVTIPILLKNEVIGLLELYNDQVGRRIKADEIGLLESVALLAANAIETARLYESARESQTFMKAVIDQIPDPIFIKDAGQNWVAANSAFITEILGATTEDEVLERTERDFLTKESAAWLQEQAKVMFKTGQPQQSESPFVDAHGTVKTLHMRSIPLMLDETVGEAEYLIGIIQDISERKQREQERERLIRDTRKTLERTQTLYRISKALATATGQQETFEQVLAEYLQLLGLLQGTIMLVSEAANTNAAMARLIDGKPVSPKLILSLDDDKVYKYLLKNPKPLIIENARKNLLTKDHKHTRGQQSVTAMLFVPLVIRNELIGSIVIDATREKYTFTQADVEIGQAIADQLTVWLDNRQLLDEAQRRFNSLQTAADVSRAASSILDVNTLIETSVNLIRDQFDFYYVGLFLVDRAREWAVLKAGTGQAGQKQLADNHRLEIGGGSMIGWCVEHREARIALDVGKEAVHFVNPALPDTRSEMALALISRDEVLGALTVQSTERQAFSEEDITFLQTMADQLANAIKNADLFAQSQEALNEAEALYQITQSLSAARNEGAVYQLIINHVKQIGADAAAIYTYLGSAADNAPNTRPMLEEKAVWGLTGAPALYPQPQFSEADFLLAPLLSDGETALLHDVNTEPSLPDSVRQALSEVGIASLLLLPLSSHQESLGFLLVAYKGNHKQFGDNQIRYFSTTAQQMVVALENIRLLEDSQKRARREQIIREITGKIRNANDINGILKTTVTELSKVVGTSRGKIVLGAPPPKKNGKPTPASKPDSNPTVGDKGQ